MVVDTALTELDRLHARIASRFARAKPRARVRAYVAGLAAGLERKNGWTLAEQAGEVSPDGMQRLLRKADWDVDGVRDDVRDYVVEHLGSADGVLIVDETGFLKKGLRSAGVQRQYAPARGRYPHGTAGRIENPPEGVPQPDRDVPGVRLRPWARVDRPGAGGTSHAQRGGDLPKSWTEDRDRCRAAGVPDDVAFATKTVQAREMIARALAAGVPFAWVIADEVYGQDSDLRLWLESQGVARVVLQEHADRHHRRRHLAPRGRTHRRAAGAGLAQLQHRRGCARRTHQRVGADRDPRRLAGWAGALAAGPAFHRDRGTGLLRLLWAAGDQLGGAGSCRRFALARRGTLPAGER